VRGVMAWGRTLWLKMAYVGGITEATKRRPQVGTHTKSANGANQTTSSTTGEGVRRAVFALGHKHICFNLTNLIARERHVRKSE